MNLKEPDLQNFEEKQEVVDNLLAPSSWIIAFCKVQLPRTWLVTSLIISSRSTKTHITPYPTYPASDWFDVKWWFDVKLVWQPLNLNECFLLNSIILHSSVKTSQLHHQNHRICRVSLP